MRRIPWTATTAVLLTALALGCAGAGRDGAPPDRADADEQAKAAARMIRASRGTLAPVYEPLAEYLVDHLDLAETEGVGIDLGSGPGTLIVALARRTRLHWINADINPHFFPHFYDLAERAGVGYRVSAVRADATRLPFRDGYADVIVSRGSFHFWDDRRKAFTEICRVLAPGGAAYIGRGFPPTLPVETARAIRARQGKAMKYDPGKLGQDLHEMLNDLGIRDHRVHVPRPPGAEGVNYGVWVEFHKPADAGE